MMQQRKPNISRFRSWWQKISKALNAVIVTSLVALLKMMVSMLRSWWQKIKQHPMRSTFVCIACVLGIVLLIGGYFFNWTWTGFGPYVSPQTSGFQRGKTLYDWLQLAIIPAVLVVGGFLLNNTISRTEREIASDRQREEALQAYIDKMSAILLENDLNKPVELEKVRKIGRVRTLTTLRRLDEARKGIVLQFLYESGLIDKGRKIIDLDGANLSKADLLFAELSKSDLSRANLTEANLSNTNLIETDLNSANLFGADLSNANLLGASLYKANLHLANLSEALLLGTDLTGADLFGADLREANVTTEQLDKAASLKGAIMPDGTKHA